MKKRERFFGYSVICFVLGVLFFLGSSATQIKVKVNGKVATHFIDERVFYDDDGEVERSFNVYYARILVDNFTIDRKISESLYRKIDESNKDIFLNFPMSSIEYEELTGKLHKDTKVSDKPLRNFFFILTVIYLLFSAYYYKRYTDYD